MDTSAPILWGLLFGSIGFGYFLYGKKQRKPLPFGCGLLLMASPYLITNSAVLIAIGSVLSILPYFMSR